MMIKFIKAEVKDVAIDGKFINIHMYSGSKKYNIKSARKIKQKIANFFNEVIDITISK